MPPNPAPQDLQALGLPSTHLPNPHFPHTSNHPSHPSASTTNPPLFHPPAPPHLPPLKATHTHALRTARNSLSMTLDSWDALTLRSLASHTSLPATREAVGAQMSGAGLVALVAGKKEEMFRVRGVREGVAGRRWVREEEEGQEGVMRATRQELEDGVTMARERRLRRKEEREAGVEKVWDAGLLMPVPGPGEKRRWKGLRGEIVRERRRRRAGLVERARKAGEVVRALEREGEEVRRRFESAEEGEWEGLEARMRDVERRIEGVKSGVRAEYKVVRARVGTKAEMAGAEGGEGEGDGDGDTLMGGWEEGMSEGL